MKKTNKTISKRFRVTRRKKIIHRAGGQDHFNARESGKITRNKRRRKKISKVFKKTILSNV